MIARTIAYEFIGFAETCKLINEFWFACLTQAAQGYRSRLDLPAG